MPLEPGGSVLRTTTPGLVKTAGHTLAMLPGHKVVDDLRENHRRKRSKLLVQNIGKRLGDVLRNGKRNGQISCTNHQSNNLPFHCRRKAAQGEGPGTKLPN